MLNLISVIAIVLVVLWGLGRSVDPGDRRRAGADHPGASGRLMSVLDPTLPQWWTERIQASWDRAHPLAVRDHRR